MEKNTLRERVLGSCNLGKEGKQEKPASLCILGDREWLFKGANPSILHHRLFKGANPSILHHIPLQIAAYQKTWGKRGNRKNLLPSAFWGPGNGFSKGRTLLYYTIGFSKGRTLLYYTILPSNAKLQPTRKLSHHARETSWGRVISSEGKGKKFPPS